MRSYGAIGTSNVANKDKTQNLSPTQGPEFELATRYGELLNILFVASLFSSGVPLLIPLTALAFGAFYWVEKFELLKISKRPVAYGYDGYA